MRTDLILALVAAAVSAALFYRFTMSRRAYVRHQARAMRWRIRFWLRPGPGFATSAELYLRYSRYAALWHGRRGRPSLKLRHRIAMATTEYAVRLGRAQFARPVYGRMEDNVLILAPPRTGKSGLLADQIMDAPGAVLCTSTRTDLFDLTAGHRARRGPLAVWNPYGLGGLPSTFGWNPIAGCEDAGVAQRRAQAFMGDLDTGDMAFWEDRAAVGLASLLHAAALSPGATIEDVLAWAANVGSKMAADVLASHPDASGPFASALEDLRRDGSRAADSIRLTMGKALSWAAVPALARAASSAAPIDAAMFAREAGTIYLIAPGDEQSPIGPLFRAFCAYVHEAAKLAGSHAPARKLDPPMTFMLDEISQIVPVPLPAWMADSAGHGIRVTAVLHNMGQAEDLWGEPAARVLWETAGTKVFLPGIQDAETLEHISRMLGTVRVKVGEDRQEMVPIVPPDLVRRMPDFRALVVRGNLSPVAVKLRMAWKRHGRLSPLPAPVLRPPEPATVSAGRPDAVPAVRRPPVVPKAGG